MADERVYLGRLFERTDRKGTKFYVGRLGEATLYLYPGEAAERGDPVLHLWIKQRREAAVPDDADSE